MLVAFRTQPLCAALVLSLVTAGCHQSELLGEDAMNAGAGAGMGAGTSGDGEAGMGAGMVAGMSGEGGAGMGAGTVANNSGEGGAGMGGSGGDTMMPDDTMNPDGCAVAQVSAFYDSTCAVTVTGALYCWGRNGITGGIDARPERVTGIMGDVQAVSLGANYACALVEQGYVWCWGVNDYGQLGTGSTDEERAPTMVVGLDDVEHIDAGFSGACAIKGNGEVWCWGSDRLSPHDGDIDLTPVVIWDRAEKAVQVTSGLDHICVRDEDGGVHCKGSNLYGQLGDGSSGQWSDEWVTVDLVASDLSAGFEHTCAVDEQGDVWCWGNAIEGQVGDGTTGEELGNAMLSGRASPVRVNGVGGVREVHAAFYNTCAVPWMGPTYCWGSNQFGGLGYGEEEIGDVTAAPVEATLIDWNLSALSTGADHRCFIREDGTLACWGHGEYGAVGDGTLETRYEPVTITGLACE